MPDPTPNPNPTPPAAGGEGGTPNPTPPAAGGEGGTPPAKTIAEQPQAWRASLDEPYREHVALKPYASINDLVKSHIEQQKLIGADKIAVPPANATPEEKAAFYNKLGRPEKADGYGLKVPDNLPPGVVFNEAGLSKITAKAHELGVSKDAMNGLFQEVMAIQTAQATELSQKLFLDPKVSMTKLNEVWGQATDQNLAETQASLQEAFKELPWVADWLNQTQLGNAAPFLALVQHYVTKTRETGTPKTGAPSTDGKVTPAEATAELGKLTLDKEFMAAWTDKSNPGHAAAVKRYSDLAMMTDPNPTVLFDAADYFGRPATTK